MAYQREMLTSHRNQCASKSPDSLSLQCERPVSRLILYSHAKEKMSVGGGGVIAPLLAMHYVLIAC